MTGYPGAAQAAADRLREMGVRDTGRALFLMSDLRRSLPWGDAAWQGIFRSAERAADPDLFFLNLSRWADSLSPSDLREAFCREELLPGIGALLGGSEFIPEQMARRPELFERLFLRGGVLGGTSPGDLARETAAAADGCASEEELKRELRRIKHREIARIAARDLSGVAPLPEVTEGLSALASAALEGAVRFAGRSLSARHGVPAAELPDGTRHLCRFVVMGMGKLGAYELNFSSDIDLVFLYETDQGGTEGGEHPVTLHQYFTRLCEAVTRIVAEVTEDGFVFRVDLRLRPEGTRGELVNSLRSAEIYYESWGQTWERAALIKARPVAGDLSLGEDFLRIVAPFVYRRYLDFASIEEIKGLKDRINLAAATRSPRNGRDLKLGLGGIREIEFFAQAHQLIYGGKEPSLRLRGTVETLSALARLGIVQEEERLRLSEAYDFLRRLEHRIQAHRERQTHALPQKEEDLSRLARAMGFGGPEELLSGLDRHAETVHGIYDRLFGGGRREPSEIPADVQALFLPGRPPSDTAERLGRLGFRGLETARRNLDILRDGPAHVRLPQRARHYLDRIAPEILHRASRAPDPDMALSHAERFLSAIGARTMFYALLYEKPKVVDGLIRLFGSSRFLSGYLLRHPELLDTFLRDDRSTLVKSKAELRAELGEELAACADFEQELDVLRHFKNLETLRIGVHDMAGYLSLEEGMFQLSALAEVLLSHAVFLARREVRRRFGVPLDTATGKEASFCVLGMGKLGSEELTYHSDLDIIFLYSGPGETLPEGGDARKIANHEFFAKVAQRMISILTTATREGIVYRLDTRLRPSGNAGPLVSSMEAFERYHEGAAQLWERQALLKCRFVAGDRDFGRNVEECVKAFIFDRPLPPGAAEEIHRLRTRMELELGREREDRLNLKVGRGGVVDVEFAVQYLQLLHGGARPAVRARGTLKALYELQRAGIVTLPQYQALDEGYRFLRSLDVRLRLSHDASIDRFDPNVLEPELLERYRKETERIRKVYLELLGL